jgi:hypothetical protein
MSVLLKCKQPRLTALCVCCCLPLPNTQIFTPLSTSALVVHWLLTLGCDPRDRVSNQSMNLHFWFHALSEIPEILVWMKGGHTAEVCTRLLHELQLYYRAF